MINRNIKALFVLFTASILVWLAGNAFASGGGNTNAISATVTVNNYCAFVTSNTAINFGSMNPGTTTATTANGITVTDTGNIGSNILTSGNSWVYNSNSFGVQNTVWSASSSTAYASATPLTITSTDTGIIVTTTATNTIYYGLGIPAGQAPGTYSQTIDVISSC